VGFPRRHVLLGSWHLVLEDSTFELLFVASWSSCFVLYANVLPSGRPAGATIQKCFFVKDIVLQRPQTETDQLHWYFIQKL
jgi:hypothetical protein